MPPPTVIRGKDGLYQIFDGVTRATRVAKWLPGQLIRVEVIDDDLSFDLSKYPTVEDRLP
jgi:hypothetical protein